MKSSGNFLIRFRKGVKKVEKCQWRADIAFDFVDG